MALLNKINLKGTEYPIVTDDGYYQEMSVGGAEQLISTVFVEDEVPYNFRTTGGSADVGNRKTEKLVGVSLPWNQLVKRYYNTREENGLTFTNNGNSISIAGTIDTAFNYNQVQIATADANVLRRDGSPYIIAINKPIDYPIGIAGYDDKIPAGKTEGMWYASADSNWSCIPYFHAGVGDTVNIQGLSVNVFDVKLLFGETIANHIKSLESSQAGAGTAWFKKYFPKPYYEYNAGELMSVKALRHKTVGFNQFDKSTAIDGKFIDGNKTEITDASKGHSDLIPVVPSTNYYCTGYAGTGYYAVLWLDAEKNAITNYSGASKNAPFLAKSPSNAYYAILNYNIEQKDTVCFNISWDGERDGEYEEYAEHVYELDSDLELRGLPMLAQDGSLYYDGDEYESDGTVTRKYGIITFNGTENWYNVDQNGNGCNRALFIGLSDALKAYSIKVIGSYVMAPILSTSTPALWQANLNASGHLLIGVPTTITTIAEWKTYLSSHPLTVVYALDSPTTEQADPYANPMVIDDFGTEEYVDAGVAAETRDVAIPVGHFSEYMNNLRAKLEMAPDSPENDGYYVVYHHDGINEYTPLIIPQELPDLPTEDGTYIMKCSVSTGATTLIWEEVTE